MKRITFPKRETFCVFLFLASIFYLYGPTLSYDFVPMDDINYLKNNPNMGKSFYDFFQWAFTTNYKANWHPLTWISWKLDYSLGGLTPYLFHLNNILLHFLNTVVVFFLLRIILGEHAKVCGSFGISCFTAFVFAIHPLHIESVAWISERKDLLYAFFYLLALIFYLLYVESSRKISHRAMWLYGVSLTAFLLSVLSKPMAISLPVIIVLFDLFLLSRLNKEAFARPFLPLLDKLPYVLISLFSAYMTMAAQGERVAVSGLSFLERGVYAAKSVILYFSNSIFPVNINPMYPLEEHFRVHNYIYVLILVFVVIVFLQKRINRQGLVAMALLAFVVNLIPVLGFVQMGFQERADRYLYLAMLVPCALFSSLLVCLLNYFKNRSLKVTLLIAGTCCVYSSFLLYQSVSYLPVWKNADSYIQAVYEDNQEDFYSILLKAKNQMAQKKFSEAGKMFSILINKYENELQDSKQRNLYSSFMSDVYFYKGMMAFELEKYDVSIVNYSKAIQRSSMDNDNYKLSLYYRAYSHKYLGDVKSYKNDLRTFDKLK